MTSLQKSSWLLVLGGGFTPGRITHAHGMAQENTMGMGGVIGALLSPLIFVGMGGYL